MKARGFSFTPRSVPGAKNPPLRDKRCNGVDLREVDDEAAIDGGVDLSYIIDAYNSMTQGKSRFFNSFFDKLIGNTKIRPMIEAGRSADEIKATWRDEVAQFKKLRSRYLLYPEQ